MTTTPTYTNIRIGTNLTDLVDIKLHPTRDGGSGNPLLIWRHTGGGASGSKSDLWSGSLPQMDSLIAYLHDTARAVHFDVASIESDQWGFTQPGLDPVTGRIPRTFQALYPQIILSLQRNIRNSRMVLKGYGCDPDKQILMGSSHGAWATVMSCLMQPDFGGSGQKAEARRRFDTRGHNSIPLGFIVHDMAYPDWRKAATSTGITFSGTVSGTTITATGAFVHYRFTAGDQCVIATGTGMGTFTIASRTTGGNAIVLTSAPGDGACTGYVSTDSTDLLWSGVLFGTKSNGTVDGVVQYDEWDTVPLALKQAVSPQYWAETGQLTFLPPTYFIHDADGNGTHPIGNLWDPSTNIHDRSAAQLLSDTIRSKGKSSTFRYTPSDLSEWSSNAIPALLYNWMAALVS